MKISNKFLSLIIFLFISSKKSNYEKNRFKQMFGALFLFFLSSTGTLGAFSPSLITSGGATHTGTFANVFGSSPGTPVCFTIIATNTVTAEKCMVELCIVPEECDKNFARMMNSASIKLYPNPTENQTIAEYKLESESRVNTMILVDLSGRTVMQMDMKETKGSVIIDTSHLIPGMYFVKVMHENMQVMIEKLIIQR